MTRRVVAAGFLSPDVARMVTISPDGQERLTSVTTPRSADAGAGALREALFQAVAATATKPRNGVHREP